MALSVDRQAREQYFGNPAVKNDDTTYGPWSAHATYLGVTWTSEPDPQVKAVAPIENWDYTHRQSNPLLNPRSSLAPSVTRDLSHSLQQGYISVNTDPGHYRDPEGSPSALSPPSNQFYALGQYGGSTPSLVSPSLSTPPTGKSALLTLTPDQEMQAGRRLLASPGDWDKLSLQSPVHSYVTESGATPDLAGLRLHTYEDSFQMARPISSFGESSVLLGSNPSSEGSQASTDLDPLDLDAHALADLGEEAFSTGSINGVTEEKFNIHITPAENTGHNVPIKVNLDSTWDPMLSPLASLQGLPFNYSVEDVGSYHDHSTGVAIQPLHWDFSHFPPSPALPIPINQPLLNDSLPSPHVHTSSNSPQIPESPYLTCNGLATRFRSCEDDVNTSPRSVLEAVRTGQHREIVNPKGVSDRTLAAAEANRKREAKFRCSVCGNSQTSKQNLENHIMSRHYQLKRFLCPIEGCSAKYGHARGVNRHLDTKHPGHRQASSKGKRGPPKRL